MSEISIRSSVAIVDIEIEEMEDTNSQTPYGIM